MPAKIRNLDEDAATAAALDRQWEAIKSGEPTVLHAEVVRWLATWGTRDFRPWPRFRKTREEAPRRRR